MLHKYAMDNLRFIRETMERAAYFTGVPGWGTIAMGFTAILASFVASYRSNTATWLAVWLIEALVGATIGIATMKYKAHKAATPVLSGIGRKFVLSLCPPMLAGVILTVVFYRAGLARILPGLWLLLYGVGITTGGAFSVKIVPAMGLCFMGVGTATFFAPLSWGDGFMAAGFGGLHLILGWIIVRKYGG